jgi:outer membrane protein assembly factor BamB
VLATGPGGCESLGMRTILFLLFAIAGIHGENWPAWRGVAGDGVTGETDLPLRFSATDGVKWKVALPERGNSTPVVWGDRIFLTQPVGTRRTLMCLDRKDGSVLWQHGPNVGGKEITHGTNPYCSASAVTDGERVIAWFGRAGLWCWDFGGKELWRVDLGMQEHIWGYASSPVIAGDLCILNFGPGARSFIVAVDKHTGKEAWRFDVPPPAKVEGPGDPGTGFSGSWNTGVIADIGGRKEFIIGLPGALWSLDPASGKPLWHCNGLNPLTYAEPLITADAIAGFGGYAGYSIGVKPGGSGDITATHRLWKESKNFQRIGSGVAMGGHGWFTSEPGVIQCVELATGREKWKERLAPPNGRAQTWSSLTRSGERIYTITQATDVIVFRASAEKYEQLGANSLKDGHTNSSVAVSDGQLFIRTHAHLWCIGK